MRKTTLGGVVAATLLALAPAANAVQPVEPFIIGGQPASEPYSFIASMQSRGGGHFCGGILIKAEWVLTAQHCLKGKNPSSIQVRVGSNNRTSGGTVSTVTRIVLHPRDDQGLVRLSSPVTHQPSQIAASSAPGTNIRLLGWGATADPGNAPAPTVLRQLDSRILEDRAPGCHGGPTTLCTHNPDGWRGVCYGDSGGPAVTRVGSRWDVVGTVIGQVGGTRCANVPQLFSDVVALRSWIQSHTG